MNKILINLIFNINRIIYNNLLMEYIIFYSI